MNSFARIFFALAALGLAAGCGNKPEAAGDTAPLDTGFSPVSTNDPTGQLPAVETPATPAAVQEQASALRRELVARDYPAAAARVRQLQTATNLNGEQLRALHETMVVIQQRLAEKAATGDPAAKRAWKEFQDSLTR